MKITIKTDCHTLSSTDVTAHINNEPVNVHVKESSVEIFDPVHGFARLDIQSIKPLNILDVHIDGNSIRELLYLSFLTENGQRSQPRTDIQNPDAVWTLPIIYPLSQMFSYVQNTLRPGVLGKNIFEQWHLFMPESVKIKKTNPKVLQDFFYKDSQFTLMSKKQPAWGADNLLPYEKAFVPGDIKKVNKEFEEHIGRMNFSPGYASQNEKNVKEFGLEDTWKYLYVVEQDNNENMSDWKQRFALDNKIFKELYQFIDQIPKRNVHQGYIAELPSGSFIFPHCDSKPDKWGDLPGCAVLYIPLKHTSNVYFKFANYGLVDLNGPSYINNRRYCHSVVNDSDTPRYILSLSLKLQ